jgi:hypothetical protein
MYVKGFFRADEAVLRHLASVGIVPELGENGFNGIEIPEHLASAYVYKSGDPATPGRLTLASHYGTKQYAQPIGQGLTYTQATKAVIAQAQILVSKLSCTMTWQERDKGYSEWLDLAQYLETLAKMEKDQS